MSPLTASDSMALLYHPATGVIKLEFSVLFTQLGATNLLYIIKSTHLKILQQITDERCEPTLLTIN